MCAAGCGSGCKSIFSYWGVGTVDVDENGNPSTPYEPKKEFSIEGCFVSVGNFRPPSLGVPTEPDVGWIGAGGYRFDRGTYDGQDISGTALAYSVGPGRKMKIYVDAPDEARRDALSQFAVIALSRVGSSNAPEPAKIRIVEHIGAFRLQVNGGEIIDCDTQPTLGGDGHKPIAYENTRDPLSPTLYQGECVSCKIKLDGGVEQLAKGSEVYFNPELRTRGAIRFERRHPAGW